MINKNRNDGHSNSDRDYIDSSAINEERERKRREYDEKKKNIEIKIKNANDLMQSGSFERAKTAFENAIEEIELIGGDNIYKRQIEESIKIVYDKLSEEFIKKQAYSEALDCLLKLEKIEGASHEVSAKIANIFYITGQESKAIEYYERAINIDKTNRFAYERIGELYEKKGDFKKAQEAYIKAAKNNPFDESFQLHFYKKALESGNLNVETKKEIVNIYLKKGMYSEVIKLMDSILDEDKNNSDGYFIKGLCYQKTGNIEKASECFIKALAINNSNDKANYALAEIYLNQGALDKSLMCLQKIKDVKEMNLKIEILKARVFFEKGNLDVSFSLMDKLTDAELKKDLQKYELKEVIELLVNLSKAYISKGTLDKEKLCLKRAETIDSKIFKELSNPKKSGLMETFWDKYKFQKEIGGGSIGRVILGEEIKTGKKVAIKEILPSLSVDPIVVERFRREVKVMSGLNHPNIIKILDDALWEDKYLFVMEYIDGVSLSEFIKNQGFINREDFLKITCGICSALDYIHNQPNRIIHRDLKPDNIIIKKDLSPVITDFGLARVSASSTSSSGSLKLTKSTAFIGTPYFSSPEQFFNPKEVDHRTDIYALGGIMYFMLVKFPPYVPDEVYKLPLMHRDAEIPNPKLINPELDDDLVMIVKKCLAKKKEERFDNVAEVQDALNCKLFKSV
ncbi:MAG: protein kinase [bacterium]